MPGSTTSRSISSTGSPARAPPTSRPTSTTRSRSSRSTSPATSSRRSRGRASPTPGETELARQADAMEDYFERVVARLTGAGYRWYETANFCRVGRRVGGTCARGTTWPTGSAATTSGSGSARSRQSRDRRWRNTPRLGRYLEALAAGRAPEREPEPLDGDVRARERVMLGLRLDEPLPLAGLRHALDPAGLARVERLGLAAEANGTLALDRARSFPRRRGHRRPARLSPRAGRHPPRRLKSPANGADRAALGAPAGDPAAHRRGVRRHRRSRWGRRRSSSGPTCASRRRRCGPSSRSSSRSGCSRIPHTSAGRVPTERGYRYYADELLGRLEPQPPAFPLDLAVDEHRGRVGACRRRRRCSRR